ncbi:sigma-70 family RNA polymerase sigma factor [Thalassobacillus pellis]|uniref:sigma-70 family RNA polymerase sigma factor n=1 Tax=Thalassobacillus pellis TaxID=748008 RepID=UPI001961C842|nr:sigma-70 family RNA polymerase sigma factor [Thalassobacillus pellis]MBM7553894.1 RNA polymerase sigma-70 factor (ECF subfamily) [Thalassobacillus pellis]
MEENNWLAEKFEENRTHLQAVAYRMLGSRSSAEDAVQESWFRLNRSDLEEVENIRGWLTTVVSRICLDMLRSGKVLREKTMEAYENDQMLARNEMAGPEQEAVLADSVGLALFVVLDTLKPVERIAFVLHDIFAVPFSEIAPIIDRSEAATRKLASRARHRVQGAEKSPDTDLSIQRKIVDSFLTAARKGDFEALLEVLDENVVLRDDRASVYTSAAGEVNGAHVVAEKLMHGRAKAAFPAIVNKAVGIIVAPKGQLLLVLVPTYRNDKITRVDVVTDKDHLQQMELTILK